MLGGLVQSAETHGCGREMLQIKPNAITDNVFDTDESFGISSVNCLDPVGNFMLCAPCFIFTLAFKAHYK